MALDLRCERSFLPFFEDVLLSQKIMNEELRSSEEYLPGLPIEIVEKHIWGRLQKLFNKIAERGDFDQKILLDLMSIRSINRKWKYLVDSTYLMGVIKVSILDIQRTQTFHDPRNPSLNIPKEYLPESIFCFYSKYPKLKFLGTMDTISRSYFLKKYDSWHPLVKWEFVLTCFELQYLEETPF